MRYQILSRRNRKQNRFSKRIPWLSWRQCQEQQPVILLKEYFTVEFVGVFILLLYIEKSHPHFQQVSRTVLLATQPHAVCHDQLRN